MKQNHPHAKHPDIYLEILKRSALPGETVLDPMCGSGMLGVAAEVYRRAKKLDWWMIEQDPAFRALALANTLRGYPEVVKREPVVEVETPYLDANPIPEDFRKIEPGTEMWKRYWDANEDKQKEMLQWQLTQKNTRA